MESSGVTQIPTTGKMYLLWYYCNRLRISNSHKPERRETRGKGLGLNSRTRAQATRLGFLQIDVITVSRRTLNFGVTVSARTLMRIMRRIQVATARSSNQATFLCRYGAISGKGKAVNERDSLPVAAVCFWAARYSAGVTLASFLKTRQK
jgi:hypothetical protein